MADSRTNNDELAYDMRDVRLSEDEEPTQRNRVQPMELQINEENERKREDRASTICFLISLLVLWALAFWATKSTLGFFFPMVFVPTFIFLLFWKVKASHLVGFHSMVHAYALGFYTGALLVFLYKVFVLFFLFVVVFRDEDSIGQYIAFMLLFSFFGEGLGPEFMKYSIVSRGRKSRPDLTDVKAYLWYSCAGAFGFSTFMVILDTFFLLYYNDAEEMFLSILLRVALDIPLHTITGWYIGIGVAKNEVLKWGIPWYRIILLPLIIRPLAEASFYYAVSFMDWPSNLITAIAAFIVGIIIMAIAIKRANRNLPSTFGLLGDDEGMESPMPDTL